MISIGTSIPALLAGAVLALAAPTSALAQAPEPESPTHGEPEGAAKRFSCQDGGAILALFSTEHGRLVAIVDTFDGYGPHTLAARPPELAPVQLIWSDGKRTLTWSPGVQIMFMETGVHRMCGGGMHHH